MARRRIHALSWLLLAALACFAGASCKKSDTILLVEVYGPIEIRPSQFSVTITAGMETHSIIVPKTIQAAGSIVLPASFTIALDSSQTGPITTSINAYDESRSIIAYGTTMTEHVLAGGVTGIAVSLSPQQDPT